MKPLLLFVHGWGFDAALWDGVRAHFAPDDTSAWDLGFFGPGSQPVLPARPVIAVGHSFGLSWLLQQPHPWRALIAINGFTCFAARPDFPGIAPRILQRMRRRLDLAPRDVVTDFRTLCGVLSPLPAEPVIPALAQALAAMQDQDARGAAITAALCGAQDPLISPEMSRACFSDAQIRWHEGGHMLPLTAPEWCAGELRAIADQLA